MLRLKVTPETLAKAGNSYELQSRSLTRLCSWPRYEAAKEGGEVEDPCRLAALVLSSSWATCTALEVAVPVLELEPELVSPAVPVSPTAPLDTLVLKTHSDEDGIPSKSKTTTTHTSLK